MKYRECQGWVEEVVEAYEQLLDEIMKLKSVEEIRKKIREFRGEPEEKDLPHSETGPGDENSKNAKRTGEMEMPEIRSLSEVIVNYLKEIGADGLCNPEAECACDIDDLAPCDCIDLQDCVPARKKTCANCPERDNCSLVEECEHVTHCFVPVKSGKQDC